MYRYEKNWYSVRDERLSLIARVDAGSARADAELRDLTRRGLLFSIYAVQNAVDKQEAFYRNADAGRHILDGIINKDGTPQKGTLGLHLKAVASVDAWMAKYYSVAIMRDRTGHTFAAAATKCFGLNWAKAFYAAGVLGFDNAGCLDTHMCRMYGIDQTKIGSKKAYMAAYAQTGWTRTLDQWDAFRIVPEFAENQHDTWFQSVIPHRAVTA